MTEHQLGHLVPMTDNEAVWAECFEITPAQDDYYESRLSQLRWRREMFGRHNKHLIKKGRRPPKI